MDRKIPLQSPVLAEFHGPNSPLLTSSFARRDRADPDGHDQSERRIQL
jgi:hypothetical protein